MAHDDLMTSAERAAVAEVAYLGPAGTPRMVALTPLVLGRHVGFALTYDRSSLAEELSKSPWLTVSFSDSRLAYKGWKPLTASGRPDVFSDRDGELFTARLLDQELRKFPPSRGLIDTPLMRREHWWYLPRQILRLIDPCSPRPVAGRSGPGHGVLAWKEQTGLWCDTVEVDDWDTGDIEVTSLSRQGTLPDDVVATLLFHDFSMPDRDQTTSWCATGTIRGGRLTVESRAGSRLLGRPPGLVARLRRLRAQQRLCMQAIEATST